MKALRIAQLAMATVLLAGCARLASPSTASGNPCPSGSGVVPSPASSYENADDLIEGMPPAPDFGGNPSSGEPTTLEAAQANLPFTITLPTDLSDPAVYLVNGDGEEQIRVLSLVYQTDCGPVDVTEQVAPMSEDAFAAHIREFVSGWSAHPGFPGFQEVVTIHGTVAAMAGEAPANAQAGIEWQENGVRLRVFGPQVSEEQVTTVAESFAPIGR